MNTQQSQEPPQDNHNRSSEPMTEVKSSAFTHTRYNPKTGLLTIRFNSGKEEPYHNFPSDKYTEFLQAESMGKYFSENIRNNPAYKEQRQEDVA